MNRTTTFSDCRKYRYTLWREWGLSYGANLCPASSNSPPAAPREVPYLMVIGLNPSTADETKDDPTIRKCIGFAKRWGFGALCMTNLFAWRDTKPENMKKVEFPQGADNNNHLIECAGCAGLILAAWGRHGKHRNRDSTVVDYLRRAGARIHCLKKNNDGTPMHPLYVPYETKPVPYLVL